MRLDVGLLAALLAIPCAAQTSSSPGPVKKPVPFTSTSSAGPFNLVAYTGAGVLVIYSMCATGSQPLYARFWDQATLPDGTGTPIWRMQVPPGPCQGQTGAFQLGFTNGLAITISPINTDADQTAIGLGEALVNLGATP